MKKLLLILFSAWTLIACSHSEKTDSKVAPVRVRTMLVESRIVNKTARYVGTVVPAHETPLSMQSAGRVIALHAKNGEYVTKGQKIISIENTQALNALNSAQATLKHAQDGYDRLLKVHAKGVVSDQKMIEVESQLTQAQSMYAAAQKQLDECILYAPCAGFISGLNTEIGQTLIPGAQLCSVVDLSGFKVRFPVPEKEIQNLSDKGEVECPSVDAVFSIRVIEKSLAANPITHTYDVLATIEGGTNVLMSGMVAKVSMSGQAITVQSHDATGEIIIPSQCVLLKQDGSTVWVVKNGKAERRSVHTGNYRADGVLITEGLQNGDTLITDGYQKLYNGAQVTQL